MLALFPGRTQKQLKNKFRKENKGGLDLVNLSMSLPDPEAVVRVPARVWVAFRVTVTVTARVGSTPFPACLSSITTIFVLPDPNLPFFLAPHQNAPSWSTRPSTPKLRSP
eukprot:FR743270.1.p1 GENE.FR743270.1~~FR743270.1.p1  ORF type:complete len:110 (+),score=4.31 FR743270.1:3-332(+)